jgi:hypothetical protein
MGDPFRLHALRFIAILPLQVTFVFGGKILAIQTAFVNLLTFSIFGMVITVLCWVADLVCYVQYLGVSGKPIIRPPTSENVFLAVPEFLFVNIIFRVTTYMSIWYILCFIYLLGLYFQQTGDLPTRFEHFYTVDL